MSDFRLLDIEIDRIDPRPASEVRVQPWDVAVGVYQDHLDELPPIHVFAKTDGKAGEHVDHWLADGNHTLLAHIGKGRKTIKAMVKAGTYADAFSYACKANHNIGDTLMRCGVPVYDGDKKRRVEVWCGRPEADGMTQQQIADVCGVTRPYVSMIVRPYQDRHAGNGESMTVARRKFDRIDRPRVEQALRDDPTASNKSIADALGVHRETVSKIRKQLGIEKPRPVPGKNGTPKSNGTTHESQDDDPAPIIPLPGQTEMFRGDEEEDFDEWWRKYRASVMAEYEGWSPQRKALWMAKMWSLLMTIRAETPGLVDRTKEAMC